MGPTAVLSQNTVVPERKAVVPLSTMPGFFEENGDGAKLPSHNGDKQRPHSDFVWESFWEIYDVENL